MAHHSKMPDEIRQMKDEVAKRLGLGSTGAYPEGVVNDLDEGEIQFGIAADKERELVHMNFGKSIDYIGMTPQQAVELAQCLIKRAREVAREPVVIQLH